jgi:hypothetical protein
MLIEKLPQCYFAHHKSNRKLPKNFRSDTILLFYILEKNYLNKYCISFHFSS